MQLPDQLFFNTGITTYLWILAKKKTKQRKGKVQLIDASSFYKPMKKSLGSKRKEITEEQRLEVLGLYENFTENEFSKIYPNDFFGYRKLTIEQPTINNGKPVLDKQGKPKADSSLRDNERIPLDADVNEYVSKEVLPHLPTAWVDESKTQVGFEVNFTKYFYKYQPLRSLLDITNDLVTLENQTDGLMAQLLENE